MRTVLFLLALSISCVSCGQQKQQPDSSKLPLPRPIGAVNDFGSFLSPEERQTLAKELTRYQRATTNTIVIATLDSLPVDPKTKKKYTIEQISLRYFNTWGIGDKTKNNGVLLLLSKHERQVRIEVGLGLEKILTNETCAEIIKQKMAPHFKKEAFFIGLSEAIQALEKALDQQK